MRLEVGAYRVEIRAEGYRTVGFRVWIDAERAITYRDTLQPPASAPPAESQPPPASPAPVARKPLHTIPGCYLGDVPPEAANRPASCDLRLAITCRQ